MANIDIKEYGWAIHLGVLPYDEKDTDVILAFNFVRPGATSKENVDWIQDDIGPEGECHNLQNDPLMFPWKWSDISWQIYTGDTKVSATIIPLQTPSANQTVQLALEFEIKSKTKDSQSPFSVKPNDTGKDAASYPHALAPLTHLPEPISSGMLKMSGFLTIKKNELSDIINNSNKISIFPKVLQITAEHQLEIGTIQYNQGYSKSVYTSIGVQPNVSFYCNQILIPNSAQTNNITKFSLASSPDSAKQNQVRDTAIRYLNPLSVIKYFLTKKINPITESNIQDYKKHLINSIGLGWEISRKVKTNSASIDNDFEIYPHVFDFLFHKTPAEIEQLSKKEIKSAFINKLKELKDSDSNRFFEILISEASGLSEVLYKKLALLNSETDPNKQYTQAWVDIANMAEDYEQGKVVYAVFWSVLLQFLSDALAIQTQVKVRANDVLAKINNDLIQRSKAALIVQGYVNTLDHQDNIIYKLVTNGELPNDEAGAVLELSHLFIGIPIENKELIAYYKMAFAQNLENIDKSKPKSVNHDHGISLTFTGDAKDKDIRGYAIALQSGINTDATNIKWDAERASWITDVKIYVKQSKKYIDQAMHETVGATLSNGVAVVEREYTGRPLNAHLVKINTTNAETSLEYLEAGSENEEFDHTDALDYVWPIEDKLPLLGYGMYYRGLATPIGNAGEVINPNHRFSDNLSKLANVSDIIEEVNTTDAHQYLSKVLPGKPVLLDSVSLIALQEISEDTRAHAFQISSNINEIHPVSLLVRDSTHFIKGLPEIKLTLTSPSPSAEFLLRWLNTELSKVQLSMIYLIDSQVIRSYLSSESVSDNQMKLKNILDNQVALLASETKRPSNITLETWSQFKAFHPAIEKLYVSVAYNGETVKKGDELFLELGQKIEDSYLKTNNVDFSIKANESESKIENKIVKIKDGEFAKITIYCLVEKKLFDDGIKKRFNIAIDSVNKLVISDNGTEYYALSPHELWFEAASAWSASESIDLVPQLEVNPDSTLALLSFNRAVKADWLKGAYIERHEWHWTGYPIDFPIAETTEFKKWVNSLVGVESYRDSHAPIFATEITSGKWQFQTSSITNSPLALSHELVNGARPARYMAYTLRPIVRFSKWLKKDRSKNNTIENPIDIESKVFAVGKLIKGIAPANANERIPVPPLKWSIPLTATYVESNENFPARAANGNMLIFDEAIRRTDSLTKFGGIGDTLEIDLMETRLSDFQEIGVNPIFHGLADPNENITLEHDKPFGLTYDTSSNAKMTQTGVIVRPKGGRGKWILAKVRARRLILPETIENSGLKDNNTINLRQVGDEYIPMDFCIDFKVPNRIQKLAYINIEGINIKLNEELSGFERLLCSFHKGYWDQSEPTWRMQILAQSQTETSMEWKTVAKQSCFASTVVPSFLIEPKITASDSDNVVVNTAKFSTVSMSDYTDPTWLTFIGSFGLDGSELGEVDDFKLVVNNDILEFKYLTDTKPRLFSLPSDIEQVRSNPLFHMLMIFKPITDISLSEAASVKDGGEFIGFYKYSGENQFTKLDIGSEVDLDGHFAYLCTFQIASSISQVQVGISNKSEVEEIIGISSSKALINLMFPDQYDAGIKESKIRLLPEYLEPIKITKC